MTLLPLAGKQRKPDAEDERRTSLTDRLFIFSRHPREPLPQASSHTGALMGATTSGRPAFCEVHESLAGFRVVGRPSRVGVSFELAPYSYKRFERDPVKRVAAILEIEAVNDEQDSVIAARKAEAKRQWASLLRGRKNG